MLLAIDVGNTNITLGLFRGENLVAQFRMTTKSERTSDEYGIFLCSLIEHKGFSVQEVEGLRSAGYHALADKRDHQVL